jgi:hypothetical protein
LAITFAIGGIGTDPTKMQMDNLFILVSAFQLLALGSFTLMTNKSVPWKQAAKWRDDETERRASRVLSDRKKNSGPNTVNLADYEQLYAGYPLLEKNNYGSLDSSNNMRKPTVPSSFYNTGMECKIITGIQRESVQKAEVFSGLPDITKRMEPASNTFVLQRIWPCAVGLFLVIFGSIFLMPFYPYIPGESSLPQILFYVKNFSDTLSRPLTMIIKPPRSRYFFLLLTFLRLSIFLPIFFLYIHHDLGIQNDWFIIAMVCIFSMTSGLYGTFGYQLASSLVPKGAGLLNFWCSA